MERTPNGTSVGVDDPYEFAGVCDHLTGEGQCRYAFDHYEHDPEFARERADEDYACPVVDPERDETWADCPHFRSRNRDRECVRCGLAEKRLAHDDERPLLEEHHLSYNDGHRPSSDQNASRSEDARDGESLSHEITVYLCRWCHAKVHNSWARITDDAAPDPEAIAELEGRHSRERDEFGFESAAERYDRAGDDE
ncbi:DUF7097 family protein [Natrialba asiatica]|uniref:Uncharacterized protein n=1 Tax=Natrialba asiatica (strain ATCC 700177 / DSM 12278 / JCM 9576 / FERM P-10747 / NBRC 102637 / 172P1) TaxID=29540 RepID=M0AVG3_NATA1|nr:hypothetical protein [Natrialba asiatica]ELZ02520.1 hypothetical protein C481_07631 [Natrialba asiatica DSM 12278]